MQVLNGVFHKQSLGFNVLNAFSFFDTLSFSQGYRYGRVTDCKNVTYIVHCRRFRLDVFVLIDEHVRILV